MPASSFIIWQLLACTKGACPSVLNFLFSTSQFVCYWSYVPNLLMRVAFLCVLYGCLCSLSIGYWECWQIGLKGTPHQVTYFAEKNLYPVIVSVPVRAISIMQSFSLVYQQSVSYLVSISTQTYWIFKSVSMSTYVTPFCLSILRLPNDNKI